VSLDRLNRFVASSPYSHLYTRRCLQQRVAGFVVRQADGDGRVRDIPKATANGGRGVLLVGAIDSNSLDPKRCSDSSATRTNCPFRLDERTLAGGYSLFRASLMCMSLAGVRFWAASIRGRKASTEMPSVPPEKPSM
jgi:hypothetical protein